MSGGQVLRQALEIINYLVFFHFVALNSVYLFTTMVAFGSLRRFSRRSKAVDLEEILSGDVLPITLIAPAYNEEATCVEAVRALLALRYPQFEILMVNDGSKDATLSRLQEAFELEKVARMPAIQLASAPVRGVYRSRVHANFWVVDKQNGGKADSINAGLSYCRTPLFCTMDADTLLERDALMRIVRPFLEDASTVAAGGTVRIVNGCTVRDGMVTEVRLPRNWLARFQVLEYLRAFLAGRVGWSALDAMLIISGAFGVFRRDLVAEIGGYATDTVGEDMELVVRLHRHCREKKLHYRIVFVPEPMAWTECPESTKILSNQRSRWERGLIETLGRHRRMLFNPKYGRIGMLAFPYFLLLELPGPLIQLLGLFTLGLAIYLGQVSTFFLVAFLLAAFIFGMALSIGAVALEELTFRRYLHSRDLVLLLLMGLIDNFGYRQLANAWRVRGIYAKLRGATGWGKMERRGFGGSRAQ